MGDSIILCRRRFVGLPEKLNPLAHLNLGSDISTSKTELVNEVITDG